MDHDLSQYLKGYVDRKKITHLNTFLLVNKTYLKTIHEINSSEATSSRNEVAGKAVQYETVPSVNTAIDRNTIIEETTRKIIKLYKKTKISNAKQRRKRPYLTDVEVNCTDNLIDNANIFNEMFVDAVEKDSRFVYLSNMHVHWSKTLCTINKSKI